MTGLFRGAQHEIIILGAVKFPAKAAYALKQVFADAEHMSHVHV